MSASNPDPDLLARIFRARVCLACADACAASVSPLDCSDAVKAVTKSAAAVRASAEAVLRALEVELATLNAEES